MPGTFILLAGLLISISILVNAFKREFVAFKTQQVMTVVQEGINKMSPTIGKAAEDIACSISKGINNSKE